MGKISQYTRALKAKLSDLFVVASSDNGSLSTKAVTTEQIGDAICGTQTHATLNTSDQTIIGGINELAKDKNVADEYDDTATYNTGDVTIYGNTLYICTTNNTTGTFDPSKWTATTIDNVIGTLSSLTTTDKSSLVGAVNEVNSNKADKTAFAKKSYTTTNAINIGANTIDTQTIAINDANFGIVVGFAITNNTDVVIMQVYFNGLTELNFRVRNVSSSAGTYKLTVIYI